MPAVSTWLKKKMVRFKWECNLNGSYCGARADIPSRTRTRVIVEVYPVAMKLRVTTNVLVIDAVRSRGSFHSVVSAGIELLRPLIWLPAAFALGGIPSVILMPLIYGNWQAFCTCLVYLILYCGVLSKFVSVRRKRRSRTPLEGRITSVTPAGYVAIGWNLLLTSVIIRARCVMFASGGRSRTLTFQRSNAVSSFSLSPSVVFRSFFPCPVGSSYPLATGLNEVKLLWLGLWVVFFFKSTLSFYHVPPLNALK